MISIVLYCMFIDCTGIVQNHSKYKRNKYKITERKAKRQTKEKNLIFLVTIRIYTDNRKAM